MELSEFIRTTLNEISVGVQASQSDLTELNKAGKGIGTAINPIRMENGNLVNDGLRNVDFDIAVTISESKGASGSGKAGINVVGISGDLHQESSQSRVSRIKFQVPIRFAGFHV